MSWIDWYNASKIAADKKLDVIMTPQFPYYINRSQWPNEREPYAVRAGTETLESVYKFEPIPADATPAQVPFYKGVQGNFWTEHIYEGWVVEYLILPRLAAIAETGWSPKKLKDFDNFVSRIRNHAEIYDLNGWSYGKHYMGNDSQK